MDKTVTQLAKEKTQADQAYGKAVRAHLYSFQSLDIDTFWEVTDALADNVGSDRSVEAAIHNLFCQLVYRSYGNVDDSKWPDSMLGRWETLARYLKRYEDVKAALSRKMFDMPGLDRGDDGFGDLIDALPLAGRAIFDNIMGDDIANNKQLEKALDGHQLRDRILQGENYIEMKFEEKLREAFLSVAREEGDEDPYERGEPDPHCVVNFTPHKVDPNRSWQPDCAINLTVTGPFHDQEEARTYAGQQKGMAVPIKIYRGVVKR